MEALTRETESMQRLRGVFMEVPGSRMTVVEAARLSGLERSLCLLALMALEEARFLRRGRDGRYQRGTGTDY